MLFNFLNSDFKTDPKFNKTMLITQTCVPFFLCFAYPHKVYHNIVNRYIGCLISFTNYLNTCMLVVEQTSVFQLDPEK